MPSDLIRHGVARLKSIPRIPPYDLPADSLLQEVIEDIIKLKEYQVKRDIIDWIKKGVTIEGAALRRIIWEGIESDEYKMS